MWPDKILKFKYSQGLHEYLKGIDPVDLNKGYTHQSVYTYIFLCIAILATLGIINYYYGFLNRPKCSKVWVWLVNILVMSTIILITAYFMAAAGMRTGKHSPDLPEFYGTDCFLFAVTAAVYTVIFSVVLSILIKWWSLNNKKVPF